ncbi:MAG: HTH-type transcriptional repressor PurR [Lentisphaerae bacterium ADurb.Bin242]|nr:MAG: HTH-type transcriptional repressor PurR [Lentisphaerae bacterium ADurb.Bin242]
MILPTKTCSIANLLRDKILSGDFPDGRIPGERELAVSLNVGRVTVRSALSLLENERLIERYRHNGTFVRGGTVAPKRNNGTIGLLLRTEGHLYSDLYHALLTEFTRNGFTVQSVNTSGFDDPKHRPSINRAAGQLLDADLAGLVIDGYENGAFPYIEDFKKRHPIFIDFFDSGAFPESTGVWFDYEQAGYLAGKYLTGRGVRHPLLVPSYLPFSVRFYPEAYARHREKFIIDGFSRALSEAGLDPALYIMDPCFERGVSRENFFREIVTSPQLMPDGFFAAADAWVVRFLKIAEEEGRKIPARFPLIGCNNTPWSSGEALRAFSSIDFNLNIMVDKIIEQINLPFERRQDIYIQPKLVIR